MLSARATHLNADIHAYPTKTPARSTKLRIENYTLTQQNAKGKSNILQTPFQPKSTQPLKLLRDVPGSTKAPLALVTRTTRPLADKTPFANRILNIYTTPAPEHKSIKLTTKLLEPHNPTPESTSSRVSSTRKNSRVPRSAEKNFQTPVNQGNCWDVSDTEIGVPEMDQVQDAVETIDDHDEIEYMPPNTLNLSYQLPFDLELPDYKVLGKGVLKSLYSYPSEDPTPPTFEFDIGDNEFMKWDSLPLASVESDDNSSRPVKYNATVSTRPNPRSLTSRSTSTQASTHPPSRKILAPISTVNPRIRSRSTTTTSQPISANPPLRKPNTITTKPIVSRTTTTTIQSTTRTLPRPATSASTRPLTSSRPRTTTSSALTVKPTMKSAPAIVPKKPLQQELLPRASRVKTAETLAKKVPPGTIKKALKGCDLNGTGRVKTTSTSSKSQPEVGVEASENVDKVERSTPAQDPAEKPKLRDDSM